MNIRNNTRMLTITGLMLAMTIILSFTPIGYIQVPPVSITIMHLPVIIAAIIGGPISGLIVGIGMGVSSMLRALMAATSPVDQLFINPIVSVIPRAFIGLTTYYAYSGIRKILIRRSDITRLKSGFAAGVAAFVGTITNTLLVFIALYMVDADLFGQVGLGTFLIASFGINAVLEIIVAIVICAPVTVTVTRQLSRRSA